MRPSMSTFPSHLLAGLLALLTMAWLAPGCASTESAPPAGRPLSPEEIEYQRRLEAAQTGPLGAEGTARLLLRLDQTLQHWQRSRVEGAGSREVRLARGLEEILEREAYVHFDELLDRLERGDDRERAIAAAAIGFARLREPEDPEQRRRFRERWPPRWQAAIPALVKRLSDPEPHVIQNALLGLWRIGDPSTPVEPILALTDHPNREIRAMALLALSTIGSERTAERIIPAVVNALYDPDPKVRNHAVNAAAALRHPSAAGRLVQLLDDPYRLIQANAARALGELGDVRNAGPLVAKLERLSGEPEGKSNRMSRERSLVLEYVVAALERLSGRRLGPDVEAWKEWWLDEGRFSS